MSVFKTKLIVAAIDFGTTYSGYAYSFRDEYRRDPLKIYANSDWSDGSGLVTLKAPTVVLFDPRGQFHSFGYDAENKYTQLSESDDHKEWKYFRRFKMELHDKSNLRREMTLKDDQGNRMPAIQVFAAAIQFLKDHLLKRLADRIKEINPTDIHWVLTVPAIWQDSAKQFMQEAAVKAGIPRDQLDIALEPEAAAIYCKELTVAKAKEQGNQPQLKTFDVGAQFMVLDLGGGTMDITAHEVQRDSTLRELCPPSGGPWGGTLVDKHIFNHFETLFTRRVFEDFKKECKAEDLDLQRTIELKKRKCKSSGDEKVIISVSSALYDIHRDYTGEKFEQWLCKSVYALSIKKRREKLQIEGRIIQECFNESITNLIEHVKNLLRKPQLRNVKTIMLVGGFSESDILKSYVKSAFQGRLAVVVPEQAEIAVVKGAVMYGHNTSSISSRILPCTYGISTAVPFEENKHPESKKVYRDGQYKCEDFFKVFIPAGTTVIPRQTRKQHTFSAPMLGASHVSVEIYTSSSENPMYVSDPTSKRIGELQLTLEQRLVDQKQLIDVTMWFGDTTLHVEAKEKGRENNHVKAEFEFLR